MSMLSRGPRGPRSTLLLASSTALFLSLPGVQAASAAEVLYANVGPHYTIAVSQNFESTYDDSDSAAADDFAVPDAATWRVSEVDVLGHYFGYKHAGPAQSWHVTMYADAAGTPGAVVADYDGLPESPRNDLAAPDGYKDTWVSIPVPETELAAGRYWLSVVANLRSSRGQDDTGGGEWAWVVFRDGQGRQMQWQNPGDHFDTGCTAWAKYRKCWYGEGRDAVFKLKGELVGG